MEWFYITFFCLVGVYFILPIALYRLIESCLFKTRHLTLIKTALIWFSANLAAFICFILFIRLFYNYSTEYEDVLIYTAGLIIFLPLTLKIFLWRRFQLTQLLQLAGVYLALFGIIACTMLGLREIMKYQEKYDNAVFANSPQQDKASILKEFSKICKLKFPASTRVIFGQWIKSYLWELKVEIDREDFEEFQNTLKENYPLSYESFSDSLNDRIKEYWSFPWAPKRIWKSTSSKKFKATAIYPLGIFLDISDDSKVVIYLKYCTI